MEPQIKPTELIVAMAFVRDEVLFKWGAIPDME